MNIINQILTTKPFSLPPVTRDEHGFHHLDVEYRGQQFQQSEFSITNLLCMYLNWVVQVEEEYASG